MNKINLNKLDKSNWKSYRFDQIAKNISERVDPSNTELELYIGLEHLDAESIHMKRSGTKSDVKGQKLKCYPGDVIFGKRRAYQRKAAVATHVGLCSAHAFILRANPKVINPQLFPFFLHSDKFMHCAVDISVGGLSPTINWGTLKSEEFLLPPKEQQSELAELLWSIDEVIEKELVVLEKINTQFLSSVKDNCIEISGNPSPLSTIIDKLEAGVSVNSENGIVKDGDQGILKTSAVSEGYFNPKESKKVLKNEVGRLKIKVRRHSIIISRMNTVDLVGANAYVENEYDNLYLPDRLWQTVISRDDINIKFLWFVLSSPHYRKKISDLCTGTSNSMKNISKQSLLALKVIVPDKIYQDEVVLKLEKIELCRSLLLKKINTSRSLQKILTNQIF